MADRRWADRRGHAHVSIERIRLRLHAIAFETASVRRIDLRDPDGRALPAFRPGAHVDLKLNGGVARSYSLVGDPADASRISWACSAIRKAAAAPSICARQRAWET